MHRALGGQLKGLQLGGRRWQWGSLSWGLAPWKGMADYEPQPELSRLKRAWVCAAGPLGNLTSGVGAFVVAGRWPSVPLYTFALVSITAGVLNLLPVLQFDGKRLLVLWLASQGKPVEERIHILDRVETSVAVALMSLACLLLGAGLLHRLAPA